MLIKLLIFNFNKHL